VGWLRTHPFRSVVIVVVGALVGLLTFLVASPAARFRNIASEQFTPEAAAEALDREPAIPATSTTIPPPPEEHMPEILRFRQAASPEYMSGIQLAMLGSPALPDEMFTSVLLIGSDASGALADSIILVLLPNDGGDPIMASIPRDLWHPNRCTEGFTRINENLNGCGDIATGPELLALAVQDFTGIKVDHYARVNFSGFANIIDWMGGVTICVDAPTRDPKAHFQIPAGCNTANGDTALGWVRSRQPEKLINGTWTPVGASDFTRQSHQQDVLLQLARKLAAYRSPTALAEALERLSSAVRMDSGWTLSQIASLGFRYRDIDTDDIVRIRLETEDFITTGGAFVVLPTETFNQTLAEVYPDARVDPLAG
jgi:LCP family protein required for cell wall assembly